MPISIFEKLINFLIPPRCVLCGDEIVLAQTLCPKCFSNITFISEPACKLCASELPYEKYACTNCSKLTEIFYDHIKSVLKYDDFSKQLILKFKHGDKTQLSKFFSNIMSAKIQYFDHTFDYIIPVPIHWKRYIKRKYNQSHLIASMLSKKHNIPISVNNLYRIKNTKMQHGNIESRENNIRNAFKIQHNIFTNKNILIIDDVITTGSTINEIAKTLKQSGNAKYVAALTVAKV